MVAERAVELEKRTKMIEQRLPIIAARLGILWDEVTGSSRPVPSEIRLTSTGTEMSAKEHVATAETQLRYTEGHLQPTEEHLADAEVHLKLVKAHLDGLVAMEPPEIEPFGATIPPPPELTSDKADLDQDEMTLGGSRSPIARPGAEPAERGSGPNGEMLRLGAGEHWACPINSAWIRWLTPWTSARNSRAYQFPRGRKLSRSGITVSAASWTVGTRRPAAGATVGSDSGGITC